jgi:hypothetical protein
VKAAGPLTSFSGQVWVGGTGGYSSSPFYSNQSGDTYSFEYQGLPPGTYQLAATWQDGLALPPNPLTGLVFTGGGSLSTTTHFLISDSSGTLLATVIVDQTQAPADFTDDGVGWHILGSYTTTSPISGLTVTVSATGSTNPVMADGARLALTSANNSLKILSTDTVTISIPNGWATTVAGAIAPVTNAAVTNQVGQTSLIPFVANAKTMKVGYNTEVDSIAELIYRYTNLANRIQGPLGLTYDANQYPLTTSGPTIPNILFGEPGFMAGGSRNGYYTFLWNGSISDVELQGANVRVTEVVSLRNLTRGINNQRVFNLQAVGPEPTVYLVITSSTPDPTDETHTNYLQDLQDFRIYPPDPSDATGLTSWQNPPKFHPNYTGTMLAGVQCLRFMDGFSTNNSNIVNYSDLVPASRLGYFAYEKNVSVVVSDYQGYSGSDPAFDITSYVIIQITTATPHGCVDGQIVTYTGSGIVSLSNGTTFPANFAGSNIRVLSPTVLLLRLQNAPGGNTMTNVLTGGTINYSAGNQMPWPDMVELANTVSSVTDIWVNIAFAASDDYVIAVATYAAQNLKAGVKVHVEFSNETWNEGFFNWYCCCLLTRTLGLGGFNDYAPGYVYRAKQVHDLFIATMTTYGRGGDVIRTFGAQAGSPATTAAIVAYAVANSVPIDELATATYFDNGPFEPSLQYLYDFQTTDQDHDLLSLNLAYSGFIDLVTTQHGAILDAHGYSTTKLVNYEGGPDILYPIPSTANTETRNHAINRHPRMYWWMLAYLQTLQDHGVTLNNDFYVAGTLSIYAWSAWFYWNQQAGTGNPTLDALNVSDPESATGIKSEVGGAIKFWGSLNPSPTTNPPKLLRSIPGRNGQLRATGYSRGLFRPTR